MPVIEPAVHCSTAREFIAELCPLSPRFISVGSTDTWLFRGQGGDWPLVPSLFRGGEWLLKLTRRDITSPEQLRLLERDLLIQFFEIADKRGLVLPDDSQELRSTLQTLNSDRGDH